MRGIAAAGFYLPRFRIQSTEVSEAWDHFTASGVEAKTVPAADEDALTMAIAAAEEALAESDWSREEVGHLGIATTTPPLEEEELAPRLARALGLSTAIETRSSTQSTLGGAHVLEGAINADGPALAVVSDLPRGDPADADHAFGAGAAAFLVTDSPEVRALETASHADEYPGIRYRERGGDDVRSLGITRYERSAIGTSVTDAVRGLETPVEDVHAAVIHQPNARMPHRAVGDLPIDGEAVGRGVVADRIGDIGAAGVPLGLLAALDTASEGDRTVAAFFGSGGGATAVLFDGGLETGITAALDDGVEISYPKYLRERGYVGRTEVAGGGAHVSLPTWRRSLDQRYRLVAGQCRECGSLAFPPEGACPDCHATAGFEAVELPRTGTVRAVTVIDQGGAPPEFTEQQRRDGAFGVALVTLTANEESVTIPAQLTDADPEAVSIGDDVRAAIRLIHEQEGVPRYGVKFTPTE